MSASSQCVQTYRTLIIETDLVLQSLGATWAVHQGAQLIVEVLIRQHIEVLVNILNRLRKRVMDWANDSPPWYC
jgi:hypothetical protein